MTGVARPGTHLLCEHCWTVLGGDDDVPEDFLRCVHNRKLGERFCCRCGTAIRWFAPTPIVPSATATGEDLKAAGVLPIDFPSLDDDKDVAVYLYKVEEPAEQPAQARRELLAAAEQLTAAYELIEGPLAGHVDGWNLDDVEAFVRSSAIFVDGVREYLRAEDAAAGKDGAP